MYRGSTTAEERWETCVQLKRGHPNHVPCVVEKGDAEVPSMTREKFLFPKVMTVAQLHLVIRKRTRTRQDQALFVLCNGRLPPASTTMLELQSSHASHEDGFLYFTYAREKAFG